MKKRSLKKSKTTRIYKLSSPTDGFTLIELLLSIALLTFVVTMSSDTIITLVRTNTDTIITLVRTNTKAQGANEVEAVANFLSLKLQNDIKNSLDVTVTDSNTLTLAKRDGSTVVYKAISASGDAPAYLTRQIPDEMSDAVPLTNNSSSAKVAVECLGNCFARSGGVDSPVSITISMRVFQFNAPTKIFSSEVVFKDTFTVRGSY